MKVKILKYNDEERKVIVEEEVEVIARVRYVGKSDNIKFIDGKIYNIIKVEYPSVRIVDEVEDYLYDINNPTLNEDYEGKFELVEDFTEDKQIEKMLK